MATEPIKTPKIYPQVSFTRPDTTVGAGLEVTLAEDSPVTGRVASITLHFPNGCNLLVEVRCFINQLQVLPLVGFIALNDATKEFRVERPVSKKDKLRVTITNRDAVNPHTPSVIWNLEGVP